MNKELIIAGNSYGIKLVGTAEENLHMLAPSVLDTFYVTNVSGYKTGVETVMWALPNVAKFYEIEKDLLLEGWVREYGIFRMNMVKGS
jgi:hypothetical protein